MGTKKFNGIWFFCYSHDHLPPHVHGEANGVAIILELLANGTVVIANRRDAVTPFNAPKNQVRRIRRTAVKQYDALLALWEGTHGKAF